VTPASVLPDRRVTNSETPASGGRDAADAPVSEIAERFFRAIVTKVPLDRIEELHLFRPLRQGGVETGIAVIAARVIEPLAPLAEPGIETSSMVEATLHEAPTESSAVVPQESTSAPDYDEASPYASDTLHEIVEDAIVESVEYVAEEPLPVERHTVYTARYRLVQKGPDRGKWEASVVDEADAPLITVEMVVRGVQRRAGEASDTTRYSGAQLARALRLPFPP